MPPNPRKDATFIVRIWWERWEENLFRWRGQVINAETHQSAHFDTISALVALMEKWTGHSQLEDKAREENSRTKEN